MSFLTGKRKTPKQASAAHVAEIRKARRQLSVEASKLDKTEQQLAKEVRAYARRGRTAEARAHAQKLVRLRLQKRRMMKLDAQYETCASQLSSMQSHETIVRTMRGMTTTMTRINKNAGYQQIASTMMEFERESTQMSESAAMIDEALEDAFEGSDEEEETDAMISSVFEELGLEQEQRMASVPAAAPAQAVAATHKETTDDLFARFNALNN